DVVEPGRVDVAARDPASGPTAYLDRALDGPRRVRGVVHGDEDLAVHDHLGRPGIRRDPSSLRGGARHRIGALVQSCRAGSRALAAVLHALRAPVASGPAVRRLWTRAGGDGCPTSTDTKACLRPRFGPNVRYCRSVSGATGPRGVTHCAAPGMELRATPASLPPGKEGS